MIENDEKMRNILTIPTSYLAEQNGMFHQSVNQAYHILLLAKEMLERGDSTETVLMVIKFLEKPQHD